MLYLALDTENQHAHPPPLTPSTGGHSFPVIVVDSASDPLLISELNVEQTPILHHYCKDLATTSWSSMFYHPVGRQPTSAMCWKFITRACNRELTFDPDWEPEEGKFVSFFSCKTDAALSAHNKHEACTCGT